MDNYLVTLPHSRIFLGAADTFPLQAHRSGRLS